MNPGKAPRAYRYYGKPLTLAGFDLLDEVGVLRRFMQGDMLSHEECLEILTQDTGDEVLAERYLGSTLKYLYTQGILNIRDGRYMLASPGGSLLHNKVVIGSLMDAYAALSQLAAFECFGEEEPMTLGQCGIEVDEIGGNSFMQDVLVVPAVAVLRETRLAMEDINLTGALLRGGFHMSDVERRVEPGNLHFLLDALKAKGLVTGRGGRVELTSAGEGVCKNPGYSQYILSYYATFGVLPDLARGEIVYDQVKWNQPGFVGRHQGHNSKGVGDMYGQRVGPFIQSLFREGGALYDYARRSGFDGLVLVTFGQGDGTVCRMTAGDREHGCVRRSFGLELSPGAITHARQLDAEAGLSDRITYIHGSMTNEEDVRRLAAMARSASLGVVLQQGFITHDMGVEASRRWLGLCSTHFPGAPIVSDESFAVSDDVMREHPDHQPASFKYPHDVSGQELVSRRKWLEVYEESGYREMPGADGTSVTKTYSSIANKTIPTVQTMVFEPA